MFQPVHISCGEVETWKAFTVSSGNIIRDSFSKTHLLPLIPPNMITNTQACVASVHKSSKGINQIAEDTLAPIKLQVKRTNNPMVIIRSKGSTQQPSINILLQAEAYVTDRKRTVFPLQETKIETMMILNKKKVKM